VEKLTLLRSRWAGAAGPYLPLKRFSTQSCVETPLSPGSPPCSWARRVEAQPSRRVVVCPRCGQPISYIERHRRNGHVYYYAVHYLGYERAPDGRVVKRLKLLEHLVELP